MNKEQFLYNDNTPTEETKTFLIDLDTGYFVATLNHLPKKHSLVGVPGYAYKFYNDPISGEKTFSIGGDFPDYVNSFFVDGKTVHLSSDPGEPLTISYEEASSPGYISTGIELRPEPSWDSRFFLVLDDVMPDVSQVKLSMDRVNISGKSLPGGTDGIIFLSALALDSNQNPVAGKVVSWSSTTGSLINEEVLTADDGRATAYWTPKNSTGSYITGDSTITAEIDSISESVLVQIDSTGLNSENRLVIMNYPSMVESGSPFIAEILVISSDGSIPANVRYHVQRIPTSTDGEPISTVWESLESGLIHLENGRAVFEYTPEINTETNLVDGIYRAFFGGYELIEDNFDEYEEGAGTGEVDENNWDSDLSNNIYVRYNRGEAEVVGEAEDYLFVSNVRSFSGDDVSIDLIKSRSTFSRVFLRSTDFSSGLPNNGYYITASFSVEELVEGVMLLTGLMLTGEVSSIEKVMSTTMDIGTCTDTGVIFAEAVYSKTISAKAHIL